MRHIWGRGEAYRVSVVKIKVKAHLEVLGVDGGIIMKTTGTA